MKLNEVIQILDSLVLLRQAEHYDNVGLLCGNPDREVTGILVCHDALENVVDEAVAGGQNLIVSFHPIIFSGLKSITGRNYVERSILKAMENRIAIYSVHTALDNDYFGVNFRICQELNLQNQKVLMPKKESLLRLDVYVPENFSEQLKIALFLAGAGNIGFYDECSFALTGTGTFRPLAGSNPFSGKQEVRENAQETLISVIFEDYKKQKIVAAMQREHPYEEVAYQIIALENENQYQGLGRYGELPDELTETDFLNMLKEKFGIQMIRHSEYRGKTVKRVGVLGGSGAGGISAALSHKCDAYLTGDLKYHDFFQAEGKMLLCDIGHFESEQFVTEQLVEILSQKFTTFAVSKSTQNTNPVNYFL